MCLTFTCFSIVFYPRRCWLAAQFFRANRPVFTQGEDWQSYGQHVLHHLQLTIVDHDTRGPSTTLDRGQLQ
jgi:hypothetical protein